MSGTVMWIATLVTYIGVVVLPMNAYDLGAARQAIPEHCLPLKNAIRDAITAAGISFFADYPRDNRTFDPNLVDPFTPSNLFKYYYGEDASSAELQKAISQINFAVVEHPKAAVDRDELRRNLYEYIQAGSYVYAREKTGELFRIIVDEYTKDKESWTDNLCIENAVLDDVLEAIEVECYRLRNEVGDPKFGQLFALGIGSTLAFAIDDTGSMSNEIEAAKNRAQTIVEHTRGTLDAPQDFVLVPFNDPEVGPLTVTNDAVEYHNALGKLYAHGGGDTPELAMRGIQLAIENSRPGSIIYVITDAEAKDHKLQDTVVAQARQKAIVVTFLLTNRIHDCSELAGYKRCMGLYEHIARQTGGKLLIIGRDDIFRATDIVQTYAKQGVVLLHQVTIKANKTVPHFVVRFYADSTLQELLVEAAGTCENVYLSNPETNDHLKLDEKRFGDIWTTSVDLKNFGNATAFGQWSLGVDVRDNNCTVTVQAKTAMGFLLTLMSKEKDDSDTDFKILREDPFIESTLGTVLEFYGFLGPNEQGESGDHAKTLKSIDQYGKVILTTKQPFADPISEPQLQDTSVPYIFGNDIMQHGAFRIVVEGVDRNGHNFQRMDPRLFSPSHVRIHCDLSNLIFVAGVETHTNFTIANFGAEEEFLLTMSDANDAASFRKGVKTIRRKIGKEPLTLSLRLFADTKTRDGTAIKITFTAKGKLPGSFQYTTCTLVIGQKRKPRIDSFAVKATVNSRFAETVVTSVVTNNADVGREAEFDMLLPQDAFITGIRIELQNETIHGVIEEKKKAKKIYDKAKERGTVAGHVAARDTSTRAYRTSMFVEARQKVRFVLTYQQLLRRVRGRYEYAVILKPDQAIRSLSIDVHISEEDRLLFVRVPPLKTTLTNLPDNSPPGTTITHSRRDTSAHVHYQPSTEEQTKWSPKGFSGTFIVEYDVARPELFGQVTLENGYFAHFFAPPNLPSMPKIVVFAVDTSGSMYGYKMKQMKAALISTLRKLNPDDKFGIVYFGEDAWNNHDIRSVTDINIAQAVEEIEKLQPRGGTNVQAALDIVIDLLEPYLPELEKAVESSGEGVGSGEPVSNVTLIDDVEDEAMVESPREIDLLDDEEEEITEPDPEFDDFINNYAKMLIFMTDGRPTIQETDTNVIRKKVKENNQGRFILHTIGLGSLVDFNFLDKLANENGGIPRRIFEGIDADIQIRNFLEEVSNPILRDVTIDYPTDRVEELTVNTFSVFLGGSELVVAGRVKTEVEKLEPDFEGDLTNEVFTQPSSGPGLITAQVRGRAFSEELGIDFDIDPNKQSKISDTPHKVQNFTEKLWAFLRLKELLKEASVAENSTIKDDINEQALNLSLKYEIVSPLTSLVVVRSEERIALEKEVESELAEEKRKEEEERLRLEKEEEGILLPSRSLYEESEYDIHHETSKLLIDEAPPIRHSVEYSRPSISLGRSHDGVGRSRERVVGRGGGGGGGGFSGDPHFIVPIKPKINICFNWDGKEGEIFNLIHDPVKGIVINGMLTNAPAPPSSGRTRRTYVSAISILLPIVNKKILISPWNITVVKNGAPNFTLPVSARVILKLSDEFSLEIVEILRSSVAIVISCKDLEFEVLLRHTSRGASHSRDHVDFSLVNDLRSLSRESDGVFGQFASLYAYEEEFPKFSLLEESEVSDENQPIRSELYIRGKFVPVVRRRMKMPGSKENAFCWYMHRNGADAMRKSKTQFRLHSLFDIPFVK